MNLEEDEKTEDREINNNGSANEETKKDHLEYSIFYYFKEHPGIFFTLLSFTGVCCASIIRLCAYIMEARFCSYWKIDTKYLKEDNGGWAGFIYYFALSLALIIAVCLLTDLIQTATNLFYLNRGISSLLKRVSLDQIDKADQELRFVSDIEKMSKEARDRIFLTLLDDNSSIEDKNEAKKMAKKIPEINKAIGESYSSALKLKNNCKRLLHEAKKDQVVDLLFLILFSALMTLFLIMIRYATYIVKGTDSWGSAFIFAGVFTLIVIFNSMKQSYKTYYKDASRYLRERKHQKKYTEKDKDAVLTFSADADRAKKDIIKRMESIGPFDLSNVRIIAGILTILSLGLLYFTLDMAFFKSNQNYVMDYDVASIQGENYVVIMHTGDDTYILEQADIDGDRLKIFLNDKRIVSPEIFDYTTMHFEKVEKVKPFVKK